MSLEDYRVFAFKAFAVLTLSSFYYNAESSSQSRSKSSHELFAQFVCLVHNKDVDCCLFA